MGGGQGLGIIGILASIGNRLGIRSPLTIEGEAVEVDFIIQAGVYLSEHTLEGFGLAPPTDLADSTGAGGRTPSDVWGCLVLSLMASVVVGYSLESSTGSRIYSVAVACPVSKDRLVGKNSALWVDAAESALDASLLRALLEWAQENEWIEVVPGNVTSGLTRIMPTGRLEVFLLLGAAFLGPDDIQRWRDSPRRRTRHRRPAGAVQVSKEVTPSEAAERRAQGEQVTTQRIRGRTYSKTKHKIDITTKTKGVESVEAEMNRLNAWIEKIFARYPATYVADAPSLAWATNTIESLTGEKQVPRDEIVTLAARAFRLTRKFEDSLERGGRLYCSMQQIPARARGSLCFGGESTVELDFVSCQPRMLLQLAGAQAPSDAYTPIVDLLIPDAAGEERARACLRDIVKVAFQASTNARTRPAAVAAVRAEIAKRRASCNEIWPRIERGKGSRPLLVLDPLDQAADAGVMRRLAELLSAERVVTTIEEAYPQLKGLLYNPNNWKYLQALDGRIAACVLATFQLLDRPIVAIHDSFVVCARDEADLRMAMEAAWLAEVGNELRRMRRASLAGIGPVIRSSASRDSNMKTR